MPPESDRARAGGPAGAVSCWGESSSIPGLPQTRDQPPAPADPGPQMSRQSYFATGATSAAWLTTTTLTSRMW